MPKPEWGTKRLCPTTGKRFYDLNKSPIISPYTGEVVSLDSPKGRTMIVEKTVSKQTASAVDELEDDVILEDGEAETELEDDLLEEEEEDNVALDDIADVPGGEEEP
jgi:uncharacterized protein (TIGR02300 family)